LTISQPLDLKDKELVYLLFAEIATEVGGVCVVDLELKSEKRFQMWEVDVAQCHLPW
jgi:hypothetical protein